MPCGADNSGPEAMQGVMVSRTDRHHVCIICPKTDLDASFRRKWGCFAMQTLGDSRAAEYMKGRKTLEINPEHPIVQALKQKVDSDASGAKVSEFAWHDYWHLLWAAQT